MTSAYDKLRPHLQRFIDLHMMGVTTTDAAHQIRPHIKNPDVCGGKWMMRADVKAAIAERKEISKTNAILNQEKWDESIARIAFKKHANNAIKPEHSVRALELGGRRMGLFKDAAPERPIGPGLTVVVQQVVQTTGQAATAQRVDVRLPGPA